MTTFTQRIAEYSRARLILLCAELQARVEADERKKSEPIAIVGMGCRFPGGVTDPASYWRLLKGGVDAITDVPRDRWDVDGYYNADPSVPGKMYCRKGGFLDRVDGFDPEFFNISPRETLSLDPQHRLLLEVAWEALEDSGRDPTSFNGSKTGVFVGIGTDDYAKLQVRDLDAKDVSVYSGIGNAYCYAAGRISHILGLHGPCLPIDTACSSSLVAIHLACQSLREGECDAALAGGVQLILAPFAPIFLSKARALAPDGHAKTFDAAADGFCRGEGCGVIVLKRLSDAVAAGDRIYALIRGTAVNHDGHSSAFTVPNGVAQQDVIRAALARGQVEPLDVGYIEAHGTGTSLGDPIEVRSLADTYGKAVGRQEKPLVLGSVKTNFGHLEGAAGIAGLMKTVLSMQHGVIPPHLNFKQANPLIPMADGPFVIPTEPRIWEAPAGSRISAVSSFGLSGTNSHVIVADYAPAKSDTVEAPTVERPLHLFTLSAKSEPSLKELASRYSQALEKFAAKAIGDVCFSANVGRAHFSHRLTIAAGSTKELKRQLAAYCGDTDDAPVASVLASRVRPKVVFLFTGQGSQYVGMGRELYETQPVFRTVLDECAALLKPYLVQDVRHVLFENGELLDDTTYQQPALFALEYALAQLWRSWGVEPAVVMGHSVGEIVAACVAGIFSLPDAVKLITTRAKLMGALPRAGSMTAILASEARVQKHLSAVKGEVAIAAVNGPETVVISGKSAAVSRVVDELRAEGVEARELQVSHAFHSPLMEPMLAELEAALEDITFHQPQLKVVSNVLGAIVSDELGSAAYWARHVRQPVRFADGVKALYDQGFRCFLELGPKPVLSNLGKRCVPRDGTASWFNVLEQGSEWRAGLQALAGLYRLGVTPDWRAFDAPYRRRIVSLPTYAFQRRRFWVELTRPVAEPFFVLERDARQDPQLSSLIDHLLGAWGEDGAQAINRRMTAPVLFFPAPMKSFFFVARKESSLVLLDYVGPDESFESSLNAVIEAANARNWTLTMLSPPRWEAALKRLGWSTTPIGVWQALTNLRDFSLDGGERKRLRSKVNSFVNAGGARIVPYRVGTDARTDGEVLGLIDDWVERKGKHAPFVTMLKREIAEGRLDPRYRIYLAYQDERLESVVLLSPCGRNGGYLMDLEFYRRDMKPGCLEFSVTEIISQLQKEGINYFSIGSTFGTQLTTHENQNAEVEALLKAFYQQGILNSDTNFEFKKKFGPDVIPTFICRPEPADISDLPVVLRMLADPEPNPSVDGWNTGRGTGGLLGATEAVFSADSGHPLLGRKLPLALRDAVFESRLDLGRRSLAFLKDHQVFGQIILPATAYLECALSSVGAAPLKSGQSITLRDVSLLQPLVLAEKESPRMQTVLTPAASGGFAFRISSANDRSRASDDASWNEHVSGDVAIDVRAKASSSESLGAIRKRCSSPLATDEYYAQVREFGMEFGPSFHALQSVWSRDTEALGKIAVPPALEHEVGSFLAHPIVLDACLHVQSALLLALRTDEQAVYLPIGLERLTLHRALGGQVYSHVRVRPVKGDMLETLTADIVIYSEAGDVLAEIEGFVAKRTSREAIELLIQAQRTDLANLLYEVRWSSEAGQAMPPNERLPAGYWLLLDDGQVAEQLASSMRSDCPGTPVFRVERGAAYQQQSDHCWTVNPAQSGEFERLVAELTERSGLPCAGVVQLWTAEEAPAVDVASSLLAAQRVGCGTTLALLQALAQAQTQGNVAERCPMWLVTRGTQHVVEGSDVATVPAQAPLWGLGRSIAQEHPEFWGGVVDLERSASRSDAVSLLRELRSADGEDNIAYRDGQRYTARLVVSKGRPIPTGRLFLNPEGTHLVTGGLGGLGLVVARTLAARGARHLALVGRSPNISATATKAIAELEALGATVRVVQADIAKPEDVAAMLKQLDDAMPPLEGIVHAAGALADGTLLQQTFSRFEEVMAAKVAGTWNLHLATQERKLKYFCCFSSIASLLGTAGQANYAAANAFMDSLMHQRRAQGLAGLSIHWGPWAEVGMAARLSERAAAQRASHGIGALGPKQALSLFETFVAAELSGHGLGEIGVISVDWDKLLSTALKSLKKGSLLRSLSVATAIPGATREQSSVVRSLLAAPAAERAPLIAGYLATLVATISKREAAAVDRQMPLTEMGFDSLMALEFRERIEQDMAVTIPVVALFRGDSIDDFADFLLRELGKQHPELDAAGELTGRETTAELLAKLGDLDDQAVDSLLQSMLRQEARSPDMVEN